ASFAQPLLPIIQVCFIKASIFNLNVKKQSRVTCCCYISLYTDSNQQSDFEFSPYKNKVN
ncbi:unnamed protein product, partial [Larinioides sclopetarius]